MCSSDSLLLRSQCWCHVSASALVLCLRIFILYLNWASSINCYHITSREAKCSFHSIVLRIFSQGWLCRVILLLVLLKFWETNSICVPARILLLLQVRQSYNWSYKPRKCCNGLVISRLFPVNNIGNKWLMWIWPFHS